MIVHLNFIHKNTALPRQSTLYANKASAFKKSKPEKHNLYGGTNLSP